MAKEATIHKDLLGQELKEGDVVAVARHNDLKVCKILSVSAKMIRTVPITGYSRRDNGYLVYSSSVIKLDGPDAMAFVLRHAK